MKQAIRATPEVAPPVTSPSSATEDLYSASSRTPTRRPKRRGRSYSGNGSTPPSSPRSSEMRAEGSGMGGGSPAGTILFQNHGGDAHRPRSVDDDDDDDDDDLTEDLTDHAEGLEVTHEQYVRGFEKSVNASGVGVASSLSQPLSPSPNRGSGVAKRLGLLIPRLPQRNPHSKESDHSNAGSPQRMTQPHHRQQYSQSSYGDEVSVNSENAIAESHDGLQSIAGYTATPSIASHDETVKASNMSEPRYQASNQNNCNNESSSSSPSKSKRWNKFKRLIGVKTSATVQPESAESATPFARQGLQPDENNKSTASLASGCMRNLTSASNGINSTTTTGSLNSGEKTSGGNNELVAMIADAPPTTFIDRRRVRSAETTAAAAKRQQMQEQQQQQPTLSKREQEMLDSSIRGRFDGIDVLSLGDARRVSTPPHPDYPDVPNKSPWADFPVHSFTGTATYHLTAPQMVYEMLWLSAGRQPPEIILEGALPGGNDRWGVRVEKQPPPPSTKERQQQSPFWQISLSSSSSSSSSTGSPVQKHQQQQHQKSIFSRVGNTSNTQKDCEKTKRDRSTSPPALQPAETSEDTVFSSETAEEGDGGSPNMPTSELWNTLWGSDPPPATVFRDDALKSVQENDKAASKSYGTQVLGHVYDTTSTPTEGGSDPLLNLAADCNIPIDVDENTFIISTRDHLRSIHEIASVELSAGRFDTAVKVFEMLLKGLTLHDNANIRFLVGSTLHNIGMLHMWKGDFEIALACFQDAAEERSEFLPRNHPDTVVSMIRKAQAYFALERFYEAMTELELAIPMMEEDSLTQAKALTNLGVVYYQLRDLAPALENFTKSLVIQRQWLDQSIRRETMIHDAALTLSNMGKLYLERSDYALSYFVYEEAFLLQTSIFQRDHDLVISSLLNMALAKAREGGNTAAAGVRKALQLLHGCLRIQNKKFGPGNPMSMETIGIMGYLYARLNDADQDGNCGLHYPPGGSPYQDALICFTTVRKWQLQHLPAEHPAIRKNLEFINSMQNNHRNHPKAINAPSPSASPPSTSAAC